MSDTYPAPIRRALGGLRIPTLILLVLCLPFAARASEPGPVAEPIAAALAHPQRPESDRTRDASSGPAAVLSLADLQAGDTVLDLFGGAGYYSELASLVAGPGGRVFLHNNAAYTAFVGDALDRRLVDGRLPNVVRLDMEIPDFELQAGSIDVILMSMSWHDLYWVDDAWPAVDVPAFVARLRTALAPDGRLVIVDHAAAAGRGADDVDALHRIEEAHVVRSLEALGFVQTGSSDALRNAADPRTASVFDPEIRGATDRFVLRFEKASRP